MQNVETNFIHMADASLQSGLKVEQHYNLGLQLWVPNSVENFNLGNFMISMELQSALNKTLAVSTRPVILKYKSELLRTITTLSNAVPLLLGSSHEAQKLNVPLIEDYVETKDSPAHHAIIRISSPSLQVYETHITVEAHFQGLRYFMYHWSATTAAVFISFFMFWYSMVGLVLWRMFVAWFQAAGGVKKVGQEQPPAELWKKKAEESLGEPDVEPMDINGGQDYQEAYASETTSSDDENDHQGMRRYDERQQSNYTYKSMQQEGQILTNDIHVLDSTRPLKMPVDPIHIPGPSILSPTSPQVLSSDSFAIMQGPTSPSSLGSPQGSTMHPVPPSYSATGKPATYLPGMISTPATPGMPSSALGQDKYEGSGESVRDVFDEDRGFKSRFTPQCSKEASASRPSSSTSKKRLESLFVPFSKSYPAIQNSCRVLSSCKELRIRPFLARRERMLSGGVRLGKRAKIRSGLYAMQSVVACNY
ncbi:hypothetical protein HDU67_006285 [Dinochytrium kinnereticum]|nr:hypothetical protein HDU67_006285 [Dinochytrium kinnereticum]